ncbi:putative membrane protein [Inhella inkyongensis]|uniref:Putative membrane protein n=1 Tax=Inhella inkyongensis TaxID=392593 RepID=A0A840SBN8_9BURK|nr:hypothetical protein [Inhella inkyongensis]MBB5205760.1 putative membrane protein [Inhella inkyongensis]
MSKLLGLAVMASYPLLVYLGLAHAEPRALALLLLALGLARYLTARSQAALGMALAGLVLAALTAWSNQLLPLKLYPVAMNAALLLVFAGSLFKGPPVVERIARLREPELDARGQHYTRRVTQVWCLFFIGNGSLALVTALWADERTWALYNGLIAYVLMATLMGGEWLVRRRWRAAAP